MKANKPKEQEEEEGEEKKRKPNKTVDKGYKL